MSPENANPASTALTATIDPNDAVTALAAMRPPSPTPPRRVVTLRISFSRLPARVLAAVPTWASSSAAAPPLPLAPAFPPFPPLTAAQLPSFVRGAEIAVGNIVDDLGADPEASLRDLVGDLAVNRPIVRGESAVRLWGAEWAGRALLSVCGGEEDGDEDDEEEEGGDGDGDEDDEEETPEPKGNGKKRALEDASDDDEEPRPCHRFERESAPSPEPSRSQLARIPSLEAPRTFTFLEEPGATVGLSAPFTHMALDASVPGHRFPLAPGASVLGNPFDAMTLDSDIGFGNRAGNASMPPPGQTLAGAGRGNFPAYSWGSGPHSTDPNPIEEMMMNFRGYGAYVPPHEQERLERERRAREQRGEEAREQEGEHLQPPADEQMLDADNDDDDETSSSPPHLSKGKQRATSEEVREQERYHFKPTADEDMPDADADNPVVLLRPADDDMPDQLDDDDADHQQNQLTDLYGDDIPALCAALLQHIEAVNSMMQASFASSRGRKGRGRGRGRGGRGRGERGRK